MKIFGLVFFLVFVSCMEAADNTRPNKKDPGAGDRDQDNNQALTTLNLKAQAFRKKGEVQLTYTQVTKNIALDKEDDYRTIPNPDFDNEKNITSVTDPGSKECGINSNLNTVKLRMADCEKVFSKEKAIWDGKLNGISGEGNFTLVMNSSSLSVWSDDSTEMLWSSSLKDKGNWYEASGYRVDTTSDEFICNRISGFTADEVKWRLPTRSDFLQADINGARFVLPNLNQTYWTATSLTDGEIAWTINQKTGKMEEDSKDNEYSIRCVGHILK